MEEILLRAHSQQAEGTGGRAALDLFLSPPLPLGEAMAVATGVPWVPCIAETGGGKSF